ncbi:hypothetical protein N7478_005716 [Penicillium angulare]|uniref:uncharacterized protein n=1 Tax=Penicillium angulare TaxID=116970 RepID=UPI002540034F|nr:uncharacterized protein N7478_005716 [Penicillium angulare]KAJ5280344.1 hypothetical protein N7478_005716 [Penicillium angulare]
MATALSSRALLWATILAVLAPYCFAFSYNAAEYGEVQVTDNRDIYSGEQAAMIDGDESEEGEAHGDIEVPDGSVFTSFPVNENGTEEVAGFISKDIDNSTIEHLYIVLHGKLRNGNTYWKTFHDAIKYAKEDNFPGTDRKMGVLAPQFFSTKYNSGQYNKNQLGWEDLNAWEPGAQANHPKNTTLTTFDVIDGLVRLHSNKDKYPSLKNVTVVGHGGGGQLAQRYSVLASNPPDNVHVRYIHGDPSSCMYFTEDRPTMSDPDASTNSCSNYNVWRYGFDKFPGTKQGLTSKEYFTQYLKRDVISIVGLQDTGRGGDTSCMARLQGGINRRTRNLVWFRYINTLARTNENLDGFPGSFDDLPDWSDEVGGNSHVRLVVVEDADHNATQVFLGDLGREALFHDGDVDEGWRPDDDDDDDDDSDDDSN